MVVPAQFKQGARKVAMKKSSAIADKLYKDYFKRQKSKEQL